MGFLLDLALGRLTGDLNAEHSGIVAIADREAREERAAILEFDGGLLRAEAERQAGFPMEAR